MYKFGQPLTKAQTMRLSRLRAAGKLTSDMAADEIYKLATTPRNMGRPRSKVSDVIGPIPQVFRKRLKRLYNLTPTELLKLPEAKQREISLKCSRKVHGNAKQWRQ